MAQNDNVVFKTSTTATIDDLFNWNKSTGQITAKTDNIPIVPGTVYFTADGHIVHDLAQNNRLWMSKNAYSAIYAEDITETNTDIANAIKYSIHYVEGPTTDTTAGTWTGTINGITELYDGLTIIYVPAVAGSSTTTLNINGLGEKTCYYNNTSTITTHYSVGTPILLTYRNNRWRRADYNNNTTYSAMSVAEMRAGTATSLRTIRADYLKTFLSTLGGTNLTLTHSGSEPYLQLNHDPSGITAGTYGNNSQQNPSYGGTFNIPYFTVDTQGHITNASVTTVKLPASDNTDYKVRQTPINSNDNNNYRILLSNSANDTSEDSVSKKNANLIYNPTENKLSTGNIKLTGELDVTGNVYLRNQTAVDNLTAGSLIVNGNSTFNNDINLAQGAVKWTSNSLPAVTSADYFLVIDDFTNGGATKYITKANAIKSLINSSAIGSSTKPVYWTGSAFNAITSYSGAAALTGTPTAPTATAGTSTTQIATTEFVTNAVAQGFIANDAMVFKGLIGSNQPITQLPTSGYNAGWTYRVANAGIFAGEYCEVGDLLIAINDGPASGSSVINTDWGKVEHNIDGAVFRGSGASNSSVGSSTQPVYVNSSGIVTAITSLEVEAGGTGKDSRRKAGLFYDWTASLKGQKWSRICYIPCTNNLLGSTMILNIRHTRSSVVYNETVIITVHHNSRGNITSLSSSNYNQNSSIQIRALADSSGHCYIELKDSNQGITEGTTISPVYCTLQIITLGDTEPTLKTGFEDGTTLPENYSVAAEVTLGRNRIVTSGIFSGNLEGNAATATVASKLSNTSAIGSSTQPVYFNSSGQPVAVNKYDPQTGKTTDFVPYVKRDGVMEIGKYIDFHNTSEDTSDYIVRITARDSSETDGAGLTLTGTTVGTFKGNLNGNAATATTAGGITSTGTTAQFWRGDNTWSNMLAQTAATTLGIDTSDLRIGTAVRTLHIATKHSGTGAGITDGDSAGITFGVSNTAYAGIYYQSSGSYGSRLYFATTNRFGDGAYARMMITHDGKVGIGIANPQELLQINGNVCANNIYPKNSNNNNYSSYDLGKTDARWNKLYVNEFAPDEEYSAINIQFSNVWQDLKDSSNNLIHLSKSGTYIVQIYDDSHNGGASNHWRTYWSGIFSWHANSVNGSGEYTEISLHGVGHAMHEKSIQLRTCSPVSSMMKFQIKGNLSTSANTANNTISIKFKFIM